MMEKKTQQNKEALVRSLGVFELRGLAREVGIASPTTKKREELISLIMEKFQSGNTTEAIMQRRGRPHKQLNSLNDLFNSINGEELKSSNDKTYETILCFMQEEKPIICDLSDNSNVFEGFVRSQEDSLYIIDIKTGEKIFLEYKFHLQEGVLVKVRANKISGSNCYWASTILKIDDKDLNDYKFKIVNKGQEILSNKNLQFAGNNAVIGRRNIFYYHEDLYENDDYENFIKECEKEKQQILLLSLNTPYENMLKFNSLGVDKKFITEYASNAKVSLNKVVDVINRATYLSNQGQDVVVFIPNILDIARKLDEIFSAEDTIIMEHAQRTIIVLQKLFALGKAYSESGNITIIMGYDDAGKDDKFLTSDILRISKKMN